MFKVWSWWTTYSWSNIGNGIIKNVIKNFVKWKLNWLNDNIKISIYLIN